MNRITSPLPIEQFSGQQVSPRAGEHQLSLDLINQLQRLAPGH
ncbi:hypothetical protein [Synechococcus sp. J7-Johnson]|nr:hypothetical protein [Synechococcus sp. J7-Johnson]